MIGNFVNTLLLRFRIVNIWDFCVGLERVFFNNFLNLRKFCFLVLYVDKWGAEFWS